MISSVLRFFSAAFLYQSFSKNRGFLPINYASTMQLYIQLFLSFTGITFATCNHDNCARAVSGIQQGTTHLAIASSDCSNFLRTTVTAPASTLQSHSDLSNDKWQVPFQATQVTAWELQPTQVLVLVLESRLPPLRLLLL